MTMRMSISTEQRAPEASLADRAVAWSRLLFIEMRRSPAVLGAAFVALITAFIMWDSLLEGVVRWWEINDSAAEVAPIYASAVVTAFAAYRAGANRQHRMLEQVDTTSYHPALQDLAAFLPVAVWSVIGYLIPVAGFYLYAASQATWGGPDLVRPAVGIATLIVSTAFGWLVGTTIRQRIAPLVAIIALLVLHLADDFTRSYWTEAVQLSPTSWGYEARDGWWHHLVPGNVLTADYAGRIGMLAIGWLIAFAAFLWLASVAVRHRSRDIVTAFLAVAVVAVGFAAPVVAFEPVRSGGTDRVAMEDMRCTSRLDDRVTVCVHPANASLLDPIADAVEPVAARLVDVPGAPYLYMDGRGPWEELGAVPLSFYDLTTVRSGQLQQLVISDVVYAQSRSREDWIMTSPQHVVAIWLLTESGQDVDAAITGGTLPPVRVLFDHEGAIHEGVSLSEYYVQLDADVAAVGRDEAAIEQFEQDVDAATARFLAMPDDERATWLSANWGALVSGQLTLEDLP